MGAIVSAIVQASFDSSSIHLMAPHPVLATVLPPRPTKFAFFPLYCPFYGPLWSIAHSRPPMAVSTLTRAHIDMDGILSQVLQHEMLYLLYVSPPPSLKISCPPRARDRPTPVVTPCDGRDTRRGATPPPLQRQQQQQ